MTDDEPMPREYADDQLLALRYDPKYCALHQVHYAYRCVGCGHIGPVESDYNQAIYRTISELRALKEADNAIGKSSTAAGDGHR